ncbi:MAG: hypothetical protein HQM16_18705 [Deltaproteobacteria bacterium]|nr:hypothetical protein [Deltaproteobacteria bacterium]
MKYIARDDIVALTQDAAKISGIQYIMDADTDKDEVVKILCEQKPPRRKPSRQEAPKTKQKSPQDEAKTKLQNQED